MKTHKRNIIKTPKKPVVKTWKNTPPEEVVRLRAALDKRFGPVFEGEILDWRAAMK